MRFFDSQNAKGFPFAQNDRDGSLLVPHPSAANRFLNRWTHFPIRQENKDFYVSGGEGKDAPPVSFWSERSER